jgi:hypothetical protein
LAEAKAPSAFVLKLKSKEKARKLKLKKNYNFLCMNYYIKKIEFGVNEFENAMVR